MINISRLDNSGPIEAAELGRLMPFLKEGHDGSPVDQNYLGRTVNSPDSVQLVARVGVYGTITEEQEELYDLACKYPIVGAATVTALPGLLSEKAWLEDFVVAPEARKHKVAQGLWDAMTEWRIENGLYQMRFNSASDRGRAHAFYFKNDCQVLAEGKTTLFVHNIEK